MKIYDYARVIRSKNAGPFTLTIDIILENYERFEKAVKFLETKKKAIAELYMVPSDKINIFAFPHALAIKVTLPRKISSGSPKDTDVYGSQQHFPLASIEMEA